MDRGRTLKVKCIAQERNNNPGQSCRTVTARSGAPSMKPNIREGREGVKWELGFAFFLEAGKWDFVHWDWDS